MKLFFSGLSGRVSLRARHLRGLGRVGTTYLSGVFIWGVVRAFGKMGVSGVGSVRCFIGRDLFRRTLISLLPRRN